MSTSTAPSAIAIVLARAGSKGVPGKNTAIIAGKPCVRWTFDAALQSESIAKVVLSSDCPHAKAMARECGVLVHDRPSELASDSARVDDAARHAVRWLEESGTAPRHDNALYVILYGNVPVRPSGLIDRAVQLLRTSGADSVQSYQPVGKHHPWWTARVNAEGTVSPWEGDVLNHGVFRRQDLPPAHIPDGGVIALTRKALMLEVPGVPPGPHAFFGLDRRGVINPEGSVIDIDAPIDLALADLMLKHMLTNAPYEQAEARA